MSDDKYPIPDLKPCPFCGGEAHSFPSQYADVTLWNARCRKCYAAFDGFRKEKEAIAAWNTRVEEAQVAALTAKVDELSAPVSDEEWHQSGGDRTMLRYEDDHCTSVPIISVKAANALIAARAEEKVQP